MAFSYNFGANPQIDYPRLLIPDTDSANPIFQDSEIMAFTAIQALQFQSSMFWTAPGGQNLPSSPVSYLRVAALAISAIANNSARLALFTKVLDVTMDPKSASAMLAARADDLRKIDDESGAFVIIEQCKTNSDLVDRFWKQWQRQTGI